MHVLKDSGRGEDGGQVGGGCRYVTMCTELSFTPYLHVDTMRKNAADEAVVARMVPLRDIIKLVAHLSTGGVLQTLHFKVQISERAGQAVCKHMTARLIENESASNKMGRY